MYIIAYSNVVKHGESLSEVAMLGVLQFHSNQLGRVGRLPGILA